MQEEDVTTETHNEELEYSGHEQNMDSEREDGTSQHGETENERTEQVLPKQADEFRQEMRDEQGRCHEQRNCENEVRQNYNPTYKINKALFGLLVFVFSETK